MKLLSKGGNTMRELIDFVNQQKIEKENILSLGETRDGLFLLVYFGEE
ncbi:MAG: hypothetical protein J6M55_02465 [Paludibacteraceae bacterium]|nr:hypothetical protein [Paludibacteraceae bacterium]